MFSFKISLIRIYERVLEFYRLVAKRESSLRLSLAS